nr:hypothetical protein CFP56_72276 [Quercus suber]
MEDMQAFENGRLQAHHPQDRDRDHGVGQQPSRISLWVRFQIGKSIGNVLRVDTHTAFEARGRTGHRKESCPYTIRQGAPQGEVDAKEAREGEASACKDRVPDTAELGVGTSKDVHESEHEDMQEGTYGPWIMVARRKNGTKNQRSGGPLSALDNGVVIEISEVVLVEIRVNPTRKMRWFNKEHRKAWKIWANGKDHMVASYDGYANAGGGAEPRLGVFTSGSLDTHTMRSKSQRMPNRAKAVGKSSNTNSSFSPNGCVQLPCVGARDGDGCTSSQSGDGDEFGRRADEGSAKMDQMEFEGGREVLSKSLEDLGDGKDHMVASYDGYANAGGGSEPRLGVFTSGSLNTHTMRSKSQRMPNRAKDVGKSSNTNSSFSPNGCVQLPCVGARDGDGCTSSQSRDGDEDGDKSGRRADEGSAEVDQMEFEGGGEVLATLR